MLINLIMPGLRGTKRAYSNRASPYRQDPQYWARKISSLEKRVRNNTPEKKYCILAGTANIVTGGDYGVFCTQIIEGLGSDERVGNRIRVMSVECQGDTATPLDVYILNAKDDKDLPGAAEFVGTYPGSFTRPERAHTYRHVMSGGWGGTQETTIFTFPYRLAKDFGPNGLIVEFDNSSGNYTDCVKNPLWLFVNNHSPAGTTQRFSYNIKVTYTDA